MTNSTILCSVEDLIANSGVCVHYEHAGSTRQVALFYLPHTTQKIYAIDNRDPFGDANVLSRGIISHISDQLTVASPLYKQHFSLTDGRCLEDDTVSVPVYPVSIEDQHVVIAA